MPKPKPILQSRAGQTRRQLLDSTKLVAAARGYEAATVDDIVEAAGVSKGAFYFHFESKDDAFVAIVRQWASDIQAEAVDIEQASEEGADPSAGLRALLTIGSAWPPRLVLEFVRHAQNDARVARTLDEARSSWRDTAAAVVSRGGGRRENGVASLTTLLATVWDGLILQASVSNASRAALLKSAAKAVAALMPERPLRRAG